MTVFKYSKARVVRSDWDDYPYSIEGFDGEKWIPVENGIFLWSSKRIAKKVLKMTDESSSDILYEVTRSAGGAGA